MQDRYSYLNYKSEDSQGSDNTILHDLALENNIIKTLEIIELDSENTINPIINQVSLGNTALILAIKLGAIELANVLLTHPKNNVNLTDSRGLSALHWACMLRQDDLIKSLIEKGADTQLVCKRWYGNMSLDRYHPITPRSLYQDTVDSKWFSQYLMASRLAAQVERGESTFGPAGYDLKYPLYSPIFFRNMRVTKERLYQTIKYDYQPGFIDFEQFHIPGAATYSDLVFHMREVCTNLGWVFEGTSFVKREKYPRSLDYFMVNFIEGMFAFCKHRNDIPVNNEINSMLEKPFNNHSAKETLLPG